MAYQLKSYRRQGNGIVVPESTGGFASVDDARSAARRALSAREELRYSEIIDETNDALVDVVRR